jgi:aryl-alcohol dehydrogenase-like predicted oxidoreductase
MVKYMDGCWHCVHPQWLADQLARSLARLGLDTLDVCLLHNPEYFFSDAAHRGPVRDLAALRDEFYRRLGAAFAFLEGEVRAGRIRWYGVSSNSVTAPAGETEATSLSRMLDAARAAGGDGHHFRVLQLPMNLLESGAVFEPNHEQRTVLDVAQSSGVAVLVNRPLNAIRGRGMVRLAAPTGGSEGIDPERQHRTIEWASALLDPHLADALRGEPLQRKALHVLASTPGVSCVLLGMRRAPYVDDALATLAWPPLADARAALAPFRS